MFPRLQRSVSSMKEPFNKKQEMNQEERKLSKKKMKKREGVFAFNAEDEQLSLWKEEQDRLLQYSTVLKGFEAKLKTGNLEEKMKRANRRLDSPSVKGGISATEKTIRVPTLKQQVHRTLSDRDHQNMHFPPTIILKRTITASPSHANRESPSARWKPAEDKESKETKRRERRSMLRSQSLRYEEEPRLFYTSEEEGGEEDEDEDEDDEEEEEWAVYRRSGAIGVRQRNRSEVMQLKMEKCRSMRENYGGVENRPACAELRCPRCAACGMTATASGAAAAGKKKGGFLAACRRLLGLQEKRRPCGRSPGLGQMQ